MLAKDRLPQPLQATSVSAPQRQHPAGSVAHEWQAGRRQAAHLPTTTPNFMSLLATTPPFSACTRDLADCLHTALLACLPLLPLCLRAGAATIEAARDVSGR